jgi:uncharacterized protein (DUF1697 family)
MPMYVKNADLQRAFEAADFTEVRTVLSSGNVVFSARSAVAATLERKAEAAMERLLGKSYLTIVRSIDGLQDLLASDPYRAFRLGAGAKRIVTFLRQPPAKKIALPVEQSGARILALKGSEAFSAYLPTPAGPVFMTLIEKTFGKEQTTRTWDAVAKVAR